MSSPNRVLLSSQNFKNKGALTPKSFANIVRLTLNLSFFKNKLVSKARTNLCKAEEFKNNIYGLDVSFQQA